MIELPEGLSDKLQRLFLRSGDPPSQLQVTVTCVVIYLAAWLKLLDGEAIGKAWQSSIHK